MTSSIKLPASLHAYDHDFACICVNNSFILFRMENRFSKADKCIYDYPAFLPEKYSDQSVTSPGSNADASTSAVMNTNNPVEETLNSDYVNYK